MEGSIDSQLRKLDYTSHQRRGLHSSYSNFFQGTWDLALLEKQKDEIIYHALREITSDLFLHISWLESQEVFQTEQMFNDVGCGLHLMRTSFDEVTVMPKDDMRVCIDNSSYHANIATSDIFTRPPCECFVSVDRENVELFETNLEQCTKRLGIERNQILMHRL